jgi:hypothetical protein
MSAAASSTSRPANSPASGGGFDRPQVAITIGLEWRLPPARAAPTGGPQELGSTRAFGYNRQGSLLSPLLEALSPGVSADVYRFQWDVRDDAQVFGQSIIALHTIR